MDKLKIVEAARDHLGARSNRDLSLKLGKAPNYIHNILQDREPSEEALAELVRASGADPTLPVLRFMREKHSGDVREIIDRAIKALGPTAALVAFAISIATATPATKAEASYSSRTPENYTLCDKWVDPSGRQSAAIACK